MTVSFLLFAITLSVCYRAGAGQCRSEAAFAMVAGTAVLLVGQSRCVVHYWPIDAGALWAGMGLGRLLGIRDISRHGSRRRVGDWTSGMPLNPNHVRVFMLPPSLPVS